MVIQVRQKLDPSSKDDTPAVILKGLHFAHSCVSSRRLKISRASTGNVAGKTPSHLPPREHWCTESQSADAQALGNKMRTKTENQPCRKLEADSIFVQAPACWNADSEIQPRYRNKRHHGMKWPNLLLICVVVLLVAKTAKGYEDSRPHVCLIGAGITSATISHFLTKTTLDPAPRITVFEKSAKMGGRIASVELQTKYNSVKFEAGASIIAESNQLMSYFADFLNLSRTSPPDRTLGLWDGSAFSVRTVANSPWRSRMAFAKRYGVSLVRMRLFVSDLLSRYAQVYPKDGAGTDWRACETVEELFGRSEGLYNLTQIGFAEVVAEKFLPLFGSEMVAAVTRVNYGQDPAEMNGFSGSVALAGSGTDLWAVHGGNVQVVNGLLARSGAEVLLNTPVRRVVLKEERGKKLLELQTGSKRWTCDAVVLATPFELAEIAVPDDIAKLLDVGRTFQRTYATFVMGVLNERTFGADPPDSVLTTENVSEPFTSIGKSWNGNDTDEPPIFKIFSKNSLDESAMQRIFEQGAKKLVEFPWLAYPKFHAPESFPKFTVDMDGSMLIYTSPIESAGSAMEMSAVSGANAAALIRKKLGLTPQAESKVADKEEL